jgi:site-specific DNA-methyltransferase (adenine-specific)
MMQKTLFENENMIERLNPAFCIGAVSRSTLLFGDCLIESDKIETGSVDLILTDLPYGNMRNAGLDGWENNKTGWDFAIEPKQIYEIANRILRKNGKMVLFSQEPYTSKMINEAIANIPLNYRMIWKKDHFANALIAKKAPVSYFEDIIIFSKNHEFEGLHPLRPYFKEVFEYIGHTKKTILEQVGQRADHVFRINSSQFDLCTLETYNDIVKHFNINKMQGFKEFDYLQWIDNQFKNTFASTFNLWEGNKYKSNILKYKKDYNGFHPTQKPVLLLEDLIKTFSNENDLVCDLTMGSGSTGVACKNTNRSFIGIEKDEQYFKIAEQRINARTLFS